MNANMIRVAGRTDNLGLLIGRLFLLMTRIEPIERECALPDATTTISRRRCLTVLQRSSHVPDCR
jgi:hypothetical protein